MSATHYAVFPDSIRYHPTVEGDQTTLCGIPTQPGGKNTAKPRPPARLLATRPAGYILCPQCQDAQAGDRDS